MRAIIIALMISFHYDAKSQIRFKVVHDEFDGDIQYEYSSIDCSDGNNCTAAGRRYDPSNALNPYKVIIERTTDAGNTWQIQETGIPNYGDFRGEVLRKVCAIDSSNIFCVGDSGLILRTTDAGATWVRLDLGKKQWIDVSFTDPWNGILLGYQQAYKTSDGGEHWLPLTMPFSDNLQACHAFSSREYQIFRYGQGPVFSTADGGNSWKVTDTISTWKVDDYKGRGVTSPCWLSPSNIVIGGVHTWDTTISKPYIVASQDSGRNWSIAYDDSVRGFSSGIQSIAMNSQGKGIAVGRGVLALTTTDKGQTWATQEIDIDVHSPFGYISACFAGDNTLFMIGFMPYLCRILKADFSKSFVAINVESITNGTSIYPNPADESFTIQSRVRSFKVTYALYDILGRKVLDIIPQEHNNAFVQNISWLPNGMYSLVANYDGVPIPVKMLSILHP